MLLFSMVSGPTEDKCVATEEIFSRVGGCWGFLLLLNKTITFLHISENEKACVEKNVSTPGISIYFEAYLYSSGNYSSSSWQLPASSLLAPQRRPSMGEEEDEHDSPVEGQPEKVKKPKKVYCYISPKVSRHLIKLLYFFSDRT